MRIQIPKDPAPATSIDVTIMKAPAKPTKNRAPRNRMGKVGERKFILRGPQILGPLNSNRLARAIIPWYKHASQTRKFWEMLMSFFSF